jgi:hypothetical protein
VTIADLFVGSVAITLGVAALFAAIANLGVFYQLTKIQWIERKGGRRAARITYVILGLLLVALGIAILMGFGPNAHNPPGEAGGLRILRTTSQE